MSRYFFSLFIIIVAVVAAYIFYLFWSGGVENQSRQTTETKSQFENKSRQEDADFNIKAREKHKTITNSNNNTKEIEINKKQQTAQEINKTEIETEIPQEQNMTTQEIYQKLTPKDHDEFIQQAEEEFSDLDKKLEDVKTKLSQSQEAAEEKALEPIEDEETPQIPSQITTNLNDDANLSNITDEDINNQ